MSRLFDLYARAVKRTIISITVFYRKVGISLRMLLAFSKKCACTESRYLLTNDDISPPVPDCSEREQSFCLTFLRVLSRFQFLEELAPHLQLYCSSSNANQCDDKDQSVWKAIILPQSRSRMVSRISFRPRTTITVQSIDPDTWSLISPLFGESCPSPPSCFRPSIPFYKPQHQQVDEHDPKGPSYPSLPPPSKSQPVSITVSMI
jgi:hypothetical protein